MTEMAVECSHPERCVVAHPFNPPYLMPLVSGGGPPTQHRMSRLGG
ncbi:MAG: 3-hydroxyacyl-CoA dehydrogenase NAD-binding domain-containing protein [Caldilineaceae bacterium]